MSDKQEKMNLEQEKMNLERERLDIDKKIHDLVKLQNVVKHPNLNGIIINVNSWDANTRVSHSDFTYIIRHAEKYTHMCMISCSVPKSYYLIDGETFTLTEGVSSIDISMPNGNYNANALTTELQNELNTNSPNGWTYTVQLPTGATTSQMGKLIFGVSGNTSQPSITVQARSVSNLYKVFGFDPDTTNIFVGDALTSTNVINLIVEDTLLLKCDLVAGGQSDQVLAIIRTSGVPQFAIINSDNTGGGVPYHARRINPSKDQNIMRLYLSNQDGQSVNLNGINTNYEILFFTPD